MDYKAKIRKLLALAGNNSSPEEAQAAMLRARELMAKHKLTEADCANAPKEVIHRLTSWKATKRRDPWMFSLAVTIAERYCCKTYVSSQKGCRTYSIGFVGFPDDVDVCAEVFSYAVRFTMESNRVRRKRLKGWKSAEKIRGDCNDYGMGFVAGMLREYERQERETRAGSDGANSGCEPQNAESNRESWGLVMAVPQEVTNHLQEVAPKKGDFSTDYSTDSYAFGDGVEAGASFVTTKALKGATA